MESPATVGTEACSQEAGSSLLLTLMCRTHVGCWLLVMERGNLMTDPVQDGHTGAEPDGAQGCRAYAGLHKLPGLSLQSPLMEVIPKEPDLKCWFLLKTVELRDLLVRALGVFLRRHF